MSNHLAKKKPEKSEEDRYGMKFYSGAGKIFLICGIGWLFLTKFITTLPQDFEKYNVYLFFAVLYIISAIQILLGVILLCLCKKSKRFQAWAEKDVNKVMEREQQAYEKKLGKRK